MIKIKAPVIAGLLFIITGLVLNVWTMTGLFSPYAYESGVIESPVFKFAVLAFDIVMVLIGLLLILFQKRSSVSKISKNLILLHISTLFILVIFELMFPLFLPFIPMNLQSIINSPYMILCQSSKQERIPDNYIAILGDSYAQGAGDWLLDTDFGKNEPFHAAHILNEKLSTDVISFGSSGASSISSMVDKPINNLRKIQHRFDLPEPSLMVIYFYEGNDITDNLRDLENRKPNYFDYTCIDSLDKEMFMKYLDENVVTLSNYEYSRSKVIGISFLINLVYNAINQMRGKETQDTYRINEWNTTPEYNLTRVDDSTTFNLPQGLQGPACGLPVDRINQSIKIFGYSLEFLNRTIVKPNIVVVYLPSVLSCYNIEGQVSVQAKGGKAGIFDSDLVYKNSDYILAAIDSICRSQQVGFIDARKTLRESAKTKLIHGPHDWKHFNRLGHEILAETIIDHIQEYNYLESLNTQ